MPVASRSPTPPAYPVAVATGTVLTAYKVTWTFATTGTNPGDNALQGKTAMADFTWELQ